MSDPAYPVQMVDDHGNRMRLCPGLTKRELIAAMAMQGMLGSDVVLRHSDHVADVQPNFHRGNWIAEQACAFADSLLAELAKEPK